MRIPNLIYLVSCSLYFISCSSASLRQRKTVTDTNWLQQAPSITNHSAVIFKGLDRCLTDLSAAARELRYLVHNPSETLWNPFEHKFVQLKLQQSFFGSQSSMFNFESSGVFEIKISKSTRRILFNLERKYLSARDNSTIIHAFDLNAFKAEAVGLLSAHFHNLFHCHCQINNPMHAHVLINDICYSIEFINSLFESDKYFGPLFNNYKTVYDEICSKIEDQIKITINDESGNGIKLTTRRVILYLSNFFQIGNGLLCPSKYLTEILMKSINFYLFSLPLSSRNYNPKIFITFLENVELISDSFLPDSHRAILKILVDLCSKDLDTLSIRVIQNYVSFEVISRVVNIYQNDIDKIARFFDNYSH